MILMRRLGGELYEYNGIAQFRFYDVDGLKLARSQMAIGSSCLPGTGVYSGYFLLDPVLTRKERLALARHLREDRSLQDFRGSENGLVGIAVTDARYCDEGVVDQEREVVYPKTIT